MTDVEIFLTKCLLPFKNYLVKINGSFILLRHLFIYLHFENFSSIYYLLQKSWKKEFFFVYKKLRNEIELMI